ncbi:putative beta-lysine N-acetyltransferase [Psychromonas sp. MB-3u-54]|uniref:putative beta-lysine N-acetyltransferase n=1 Tax=Psychromonas sp. MB-3u-54 TaxID=2058319 RepID=UPI000C34973B|nr:putative beta-lysine N-acetyltransferase [Psychromonas sp. MB-3u-54]PKH02127.1 putative beta-lysine N-acetyltransferase [Psychromonas sp. MB-3u-54]
MDSKNIIEKFEGSMIQHGSYNDRIYLIKLADEAPSTTPYSLIDLARKNNYSKIFAKVPECHSALFLAAGFEEEARVSAFYNGKIEAVFLGFYLNAECAAEPDLGKMDEILKIALKKQASKSKCHLNDNLTLRICNEADVITIADIYKNTFQSYPFPIDDPAYILNTMKSHIDYFGIEYNGRLVAVSSADMDKQSSNAEMTDFATLPEWQGNGFAQCLLLEMENAMKNKGIKTAYTIARAMSAGMNITFRKAGYKFGGRLKNNTNISGNIESMNVWYKHLIS